MNQVYIECLDKIIVDFIDDILLYSRNGEDHEGHLRKVLEILREKLYVKFSKCVFFLDKVSFLGHNISKEGVVIDPSKIKSIKNWPTTKNVIDV